MFSKDVNLYEVLGLQQAASQDDVKRAFRALAAQHHPDKNPGNAEAEAKFKRVNEAFQTLSDVNKRAEYDAFLRGDLHDPFGGGWNINDAMRDMFNGQWSSPGWQDFFTGHSPRQTRRTHSIQRTVTLTLLEVVQGCKKDVTVDVPQNCAACSGSGAKCEPGQPPPKCRQCNGTGHVTRNHGVLVISGTCPSCVGQGVTPGEPCQSCSGRGTSFSKRNLKVTVPAGIDDGQTVRIVNASPGDQPWDLFLQVQVVKDPRFVRRGNNLHASVFASFRELVTGGTWPVQLLDGTQHSLAVSPLMKPGDEIVIKGLGVPDVNGRGKGHLIVKLELKMPSKEKLTPEVMELLGKLEEKLS